MRPLKLVMTAFGPYAGNETVDFRLLGECGFFLIHGPTGSGKTTILDAMCYSLFGKTSGEVRDGKEMRSDYVEPAMATEVIFDFALGDELYRVRRCPEQEVLKKRGSGTTRIAPEATLWKRTGLADDAAEGAVVASGANKVTEAAENLLSFKYEQFRQVVMLPQGEFRRLLLANSKDRENIMETLFQTELYRRVEEYFKQSARSLEGQVKELDAKKNWTLQEAGTSSAEELTARLAEDGARYVESAKAADAARLVLQKVRAELIAAQRLAEQFADRRQAAEGLIQLSSQAAAISEKGRELAQAQKAALLAEVAGQVRRREQELTEAISALDTTRGLLLEAEKLHQLETENYRREERREKERADAAQRVIQLEEMRGKLAQLDEARQGLQAARSVAEKSAAVSAGLGVELEKRSEMLKLARQEREILQAAAGQFAACQSQATEAERFVKAKENLDDLRKEYKSVAQSHASMAKEVAQAEEAVDSARRELDALHVSWRQGQAAELATSLEPGKPCPVCGSEHHPAPAAGGETIPAAAHLEMKQQRLRQQEVDLDDKRKKLNDIFAKMEGILGQGKSQKDQLGDKAEVDIAVLRGAVEQAASALTTAREAAARLLVVEKAITDMENGLMALQQEFEAAERGAKEVYAALEAAKAVVTEREASVPEELRTTDLLAAELRQAVLRRDELEWLFKQAREAAEQSGNAVVRLSADRDAAVKNIADLEVKLKSDREGLMQRITEAGFSGETDFRMALRIPAVMEALQQEIRDYETVMALARDRAERAEAAIAGLAEPDIAAAAAAAQEAEAACEAAIAAQVRLQENIDKQKSWLNLLKKLDGELAGREEEYKVLGRLAEVANGQNQLRLSFHRFVLSALLEEVMLAANARLRKMSRGRYALRRMTDPLHRGMAGGLDIEIEDNYTGTARHVTTLSGGETFLASLSLALGLADVVQSFSGGIYLDTIFVDEGFGTLDPESLDMAMQALVELQYKGRLVGIISHVPELKERIEARLEIIPTELGSTTRWSALPGKR